ncbi:hypothetical protein VE03_03120 [Pseudogymnoascus sp. 23342-1-I1]|nr:hypothetical protein VE03_03120 [Pseudogymnoascus sp. 23342-1-I1]
MHFLVYLLGFVLALCGISSAAPAALASLPQHGHAGNYCSIITVYVTVTEDPLLHEVRTFGDVAHHLNMTQYAGAIPDELTTTTTRTSTAFETVIISGVSRSDTHIGDSTAVHFLHDGLIPTEKEEPNGPATLTTTSQPVNENEGPNIPATVNTTSETLAVPTGTDESKAPLSGNTVSQYLTPATGTAATQNPVTIDTTSQFLTAPTGTGASITPVMDNTTAPIETQSVSSDDGVVIQTLTVYPVESIAPETSSDNPLHHTHGGPPTPHDPMSASLFPTSSETTPTQTIGIQANATIPAAIKRFTNDEIKPFENKDALGAIPFAVATPVVTASPPADIHAPLDPSTTTVTLRLPFITTTLTVTGDFSKGTIYASGSIFSIYTPGQGEAALGRPTPPPADSATATPSVSQATTVHLLATPVGPPANTHAPRVPLDAVETTFTLKIPLITTLTVTGDISGTLITSGRSFSTYIPRAVEAALGKHTPHETESIAATSTVSQAIAVPSLATPMGPPANTHAPRVPLDAVETTFTLKLPFITLTVTGDLSTGSLGTNIRSGHSFATHIPRAGEAELGNLTPHAVEPVTATSAQSPATAVPSPQHEPVTCGEEGIFRLTFDDIPRLAGSNDIQPQPIYSPYHHFYFSQGFVVAPPPKDPYTPASAPLLLEFVTQSNVDATRTHNSHPTEDYGTTGEIGIGQNLQWGCYDFNALSASVGCDSLGPHCDWQFTGVQWDYKKQVYEEVVTQFVSTAGCPGLVNCKLMDVVLLDEFTHLHALRVNVTVAGEPKGWWMDDLKLEWADGRCDAGLCRVMHR